MKKILVLNYEFPPLGGGAGNATFYLLKEFAKMPDLEIDLVTSSVSKFRVEKLSPNITVHYLDIKKSGDLHYQSDKNLLIYSWKAYRYCRALMKIKHFDLVHAFFGVPCGYIAMKLGLPYIVSLRGSDVPFYNKRFYWLDKLVFKNLSKKIWRKAKAVIVNSQGLKELANTSIPDQKIDIIHNGVDIEEFRPAEKKEKHEKIQLVSTGRLIKRKGYDYLIKAINGLDQYELTLIGNGPEKETLAELARESSVNVNFIGGIGHQEIPKYLQKADIFILPSLNEGMSNSILEAMACGLSIITTDTGGSDELVGDNGFIAQKASTLSLREILKKYINDPKLVGKQSKSSRQRAEAMSWGSVAIDYQKTYYTKV